MGLKENRKARLILLCQVDSSFSDLYLPAYAGKSAQAGTALGDA
ncbi:MAG: hypothetical protein ACQETL_08580 [Bacteroidota bacterium]